MQDKKQFLDILIGAIRRETDAFNYYYAVGENRPLWSVSESLLIQVAEEHKILSSSEMVKSS
jgi:hypothetical protein